MESADSLLAPLEGEQQSLPEMEHLAPKTRSQPGSRSKPQSPTQMPIMAAVRDDSEREWPLRPAKPGPGQLNFESEQMALEDIRAEPVQLQLLDEPPPWELPEKPSATRQPGRLAKKRNRRGITPGQTSLF